MAGGASAGTKMTHGTPTRAAMQAIELPALPVEAPATTSAPSSRARVTATALARSLNEALGFRPSSLSSRFSSPAVRPSRLARNSGVAPMRRLGASDRSLTGSSGR